MCHCLSSAVAGQHAILMCIPDPERVFKLKCSFSELYGAVERLGLKEIYGRVYSSVEELLRMSDISNSF